MITFDDDGNQSRPDIKVGDYVTVISIYDLSQDLFNVSFGRALHISGYSFSLMDCAQEGYVKSIDGSHPVLYTLDSGPCVPYDALKLVRSTKSKKCECSKEKYGFTWHSSWCDLYTSPYGDNK